jgi:uncharacterized membrane protein YsdA (DUF1294 family)/cold shock CspA family protein
MDNQLKGKIRKWDDEKGFGFITSEQGEKNVFFHISDVANRRYRPSEETPVTYTLSYDDRQRPRARNVRFMSPPAYSSIIPSFVSGLFFTLLIIVTRIYDKSLLIPVVSMVVSILTFLAYGYDKSQAMQKKQRVPERSLHLLSLLCGWPGALIAQHHYHHKNRKSSFQFTYWVVVVMNIGALTLFFLATSHPN